MWTHLYNFSTERVGLSPRAKRVRLGFASFEKEGDSILQKRRVSLRLEREQAEEARATAAAEERRRTLRLEAELRADERCKKEKVFPFFLSLSKKRWPRL